MIRSDNKIFDYLVTNNKANIACLVILFNINNKKEIARTTTDNKGYYEFLTAQLKTGTYELQFYGSDTVQKLKPDGDWERFDFISSKETDSIREILFDTLPTFQATEKNTFIDASKAEKTVIEFNLTNIAPLSGIIKIIEIWYKIYEDGEQSEHTQDELDEKYRLLNSFIYTETIPPVFSTKLEYEMQVPEKGKEYDFFVIFYNGIGVPAVVKIMDEGTEYEEVAKLRDRIEINGVPDLEEIFGVYNLRLMNEEVGNTEAGKLANTFAKLEWLDFKKQERSFFGQTGATVFSGWDGTSALLTYEQAKKIEKYVIYMRVTDDPTQPPYSYPADIPTWYLVAETDTNTVEIRCPPSKYVAFYCGFRMEGTVTRIEKRNIIY
jgi:hypothetical protein